MLLGALATGQLLLCVTSIIEFTDIFGGVLLGCAVFFGYLGFANSMNVTYIVIWGMFSLVHGLYASIFASVMMIIDAITFKFTTMVTHLVICLVSLVSSVLSWRIYEDFENEAPRDDLIGHFLIRVGILNAPDESTRLLAGVAAKQMTAGSQQAPQGMLSGLFGAFSPPATGNLEAQGTAAANQGAAQARRFGGGMMQQGAQGMAAANQGTAQMRRGMAAAESAEGDVMFDASRPGSTGMLAGLFGAASIPATGDVEARGAAAANQGAAQVRQGMAAARDHGQAGMANAQGWLASAQAQQGIPTSSSLGARSNIARDPFLTGGYP